MDLKEQSNIRQDQTRECRGDGSDSFRSGQFRKISIGVTVNASPQTKCGVRKGDGANKVDPCKGKSIEESKEVGREAPLTEKQAEVPDLGMNGWLSTKSLRQETTTMKSVQFYTNWMSVLQAGDGVCNRVDRITYARKRKKGGSTEKVQEFAFASTREMPVFDKGTEGEQPEITSNGRVGEKPKEISKGSNEALKMKLWEILGTAPQHVDLHAQQTGAQDLKIENKGQESDKIFKPKQNSDTIETDSESPLGRPATHSLAQKKSLAKRQLKLQHEINNEGNSPIATRTSLKQKGQRNNIFAFDEAEGAETLQWAVSGSSSLDRKKNVKKNTKIEPQRISFPRKTVPQKNLHATEEKKTVSTSGKSSSRSSRTKGLHSPYQNDKDKIQPKNALVQEESRHSPVKKKADLQVDFNDPPSSEETRPQQCFGSPSLQKKTGPHENFESQTSPRNSDLQEDFGSPTQSLHDDCQSPTFAADTTVENNITSKSLPQDTPLGEFQFPATSGKRFELEEFSSLRAFRTPAPGSSGPDTHASSDDSREFKESPIQGPSPTVENKDTQEQLSSSPTEEQGSGSTEEFIGEGYKSSPEFTGTEESNGYRGASAQAQENGLGRAIARFALVLERFKTKMNSQTSKKSAEILATVDDRIRLQLQTVESQIQTDVSKFTSHGKSKRKRLESRFQELQERLELLHDKYKEEVNQHLKDCRSAFEESEADQVELKGHAEKQKASHMKLLSQVAETIQIQLGDANKSIEAINKAARRRMQGLQRALRDCLSEGIFS